jgi:hypothetical protein
MEYPGEMKEGRNSGSFPPPHPQWSSFLEIGNEKKTISLTLTFGSQYVAT